MDRRAARGFTMVETMVAVAIASVALLTLGGMLIHNMQANEGSEQRMDAAAVSQGILNDYAARLLAHSWTPGNQTVSGVKGGFRYALSASQTADASHTVLAVTLQPLDGSRMEPYQNQTLVTVVGGGSYSTVAAGSSSQSKSGEDGKSNAGKETGKAQSQQVRDREGKDRSG